MTSKTGLKCYSFTRTIYILISLLEFYTPTKMDHIYRIKNSFIESIRCSTPFFIGHLLQIYTHYSRLEIREILNLRYFFALLVSVCHGVCIGGSFSMYYRNSSDCDLILCGPKKDMQCF